MEWNLPNRISRMILALEMVIIILNILIKLYSFLFVSCPVLLTVGAVFLSVILDLSPGEPPLGVHPEVGDTLVGRFHESVLHLGGSCLLATGSNLSSFSTISEIMNYFTIHFTTPGHLSLLISLSSHLHYFVVTTNYSSWYKSCMLCSHIFGALPILYHNLQLHRNDNFTLFISHSVSSACSQLQLHRIIVGAIWFVSARA